MRFLFRSDTGRRVVRAPRHTERRLSLPLLPVMWGVDVEGVVEAL
jgi:hypothetical protein